jgi:hypothetical protein
VLLVIKAENGRRPRDLQLHSGARNASRPVALTDCLGLGAISPIPAYLRVTSAMLWYLHHQVSPSSVGTVNMP